ncbi:DUF3105 domain-containing protein [Streptomycetaceae bacterium NBC_01309]
MTNQEKKARKSAQLADARRRLAAQRERERRARRRRTVLTAAVVGAASVALVAGLVWVVRSDDKASEPASGGDPAAASGEPLVADVKPVAPGTAGSKIAGVAAFTASQGHEGKREIRYEQAPPAGGEHDPAWLNCGTYDQPVAARNAVHSLEHGAVWVVYRPDLPADQIRRLKDKVRGKTYTILSPMDGLATPVAVSAWGLQLPLPDPDDARLDEFLAAYREGPQAPEPGATCSGGVGKPA